MGDTVIIEEEPKPAKPDVVLVVPESKPKPDKVVVEKTTVTETRRTE